MLIHLGVWSLLCIAATALQPLRAQSVATLQGDTLYRQSFDINPGLSGTVLPPEFTLYDENGLASATVALQPNPVNPTPGPYNFGARVGVVGGNNWDTAAFVLAVFVRATQFDLQLASLLIPGTFTGGASTLDIAYSTSSPTGGYVNLPGTGLPFTGLSGPTQISLSLPATLNFLNDTLYLRWRYRRGSGVGNFGRGLTLDNVQLRARSRALGLSLGGDQRICGDGPFTLQPSFRLTPVGPLSYLWSTGATSPTLAVTADGLYRLRLSGSYADPATPGGTLTLVDSAEAFLEFVAQPDSFQLAPLPGGVDRSGLGSLASPDTHCVGRALTYLLSTPTGYLDGEYGSRWQYSVVALPAQGGGSYQGTATLLPPQSGQSARLRLQPQTADGGRLFELRVQATDLGTGCSVGLTRYLRLEALPGSGLPLDTALCGFPAQLAARPGFVSYLWSDGSTQASRPLLSGGLYWVEMTSAFGCRARDTVQVSLSVIQPVLPADTAHCGPLVLDAGNPDAEVTWLGQPIGRLLPVTASGTYRVRYRTASNCIFLDSVRVELRPLPQSQLPDTLRSCAGEPTLLSTGAASGQTVQWFRDSLLLPGATGPSLLADLPGTYIARIENLQCRLDDTLQLIALPRPSLSLGPDVQACDRAFIVPTADPSLQYFWSNGTTAPMLVVDYSGTFVCQVRDAQGCTQTDTVRVRILPPVVPRIVAPAQVEVGAFVDFDVPVPPGSAQGWEWTFGNGAFTLLPPPVYTVYHQPGTYQVRLVTRTTVCGFDTLFHTLEVRAATGRRAGEPGGLRLYPNPALDWLSLQLPSAPLADLRYHVLDTQGRLVACGVQSLAQPLSIAGLPAGVYQLQLEVPDGTAYTARFVKRAP